jgi:hypothetical protein|tara:strand:- start:192 stop:341 length:150 start_codon:yes stop_codon:yes gene_type:complete
MIKSGEAVGQAEIASSQLSRGPSFRVTRFGDHPKLSITLLSSTNHIFLL